MQLEIARAYSQSELPQEVQYSFSVYYYEFLGKPINYNKRGIFISMGFPLCHNLLSCFQNHKSHHQSWIKKQSWGNSQCFILFLTPSPPPQSFEISK